MTKISGLPLDTSLALGDIIALINSTTNATSKATLQSLINLAFNNIPTGAITVAVYTTSSNISITTATSNVTIPPTVTFTASGTQRYRVMFHAQDFYYNAGSAGYDNIKFWDGAVGSGTILGTFQKGGIAVGTSLPCFGFAEWVPSAGSHTINMSVNSSGAGNSFIIEPSTGMGTILKVELVP